MTSLFSQFFSNSPNSTSLLPFSLSKGPSNEDHSNLILNLHHSNSPDPSSPSSSIPTPPSDDSFFSQFFESKSTSDSEFEALEQIFRGGEEGFKGGSYNLHPPRPLSLPSPQISTTIPRITLTPTSPSLPCILSTTTSMSTSALPPHTPSQPFQLAMQHPSTTQVPPNSNNPQYQQMGFAFPDESRRGWNDVNVGMGGNIGFSNLPPTNPQVQLQVQGGSKSPITTLPPHHPSNPSTSTSTSTPPNHQLLPPHHQHHPHSPTAPSSSSSNPLTTTASPYATFPYPPSMPLPVQLPVSLGGPQQVHDPFLVAGQGQGQAQGYIYAGQGGQGYPGGGGGGDRWFAAAGGGGGAGSVGTGGVDPMQYGFSIKTRRRTSAYQLKILEREFEVNCKPDPKRREELSVELEMNPREIQFQNRRAKVKKMQRNKEKEKERDNKAKPMMGEISDSKESIPGSVSVSAVPSTASTPAFNTPSTALSSLPALPSGNSTCTNTPTPSNAGLGSGMGNFNNCSPVPLNQPFPPSNPSSSPSSPSSDSSPPSQHQHQHVVKVKKPWEEEDVEGLGLRRGSCPAVFGTEVKGEGEGRELEHHMPIHHAGRNGGYGVGSSYGLSGGGAQNQTGSLPNPMVMMPSGGDPGRRFSLPVVNSNGNHQDQVMTNGHSGAGGFYPNSQRFVVQRGGIWAGGVKQEIEGLNGVSIENNQNHHLNGQGSFGGLMEPVPINNGSGGSGTSGFLMGGSQGGIGNPFSVNGVSSNSSSSDDLSTSSSFFGSSGHSSSTSGSPSSSITHSTASSSSNSSLQSANYFNPQLSDNPNFWPNDFDPQSRRSSCPAELTRDFGRVGLDSRRGSAVVGGGMIGREDEGSGGNWMNSGFPTRGNGFPEFGGQFAGGHGHQNSNPSHPHSQPPHPPQNHPNNSNPNSTFFSNSPNWSNNHHSNDFGLGGGFHQDGYGRKGSTTGLLPTIKERGSMGEEGVNGVWDGQGQGDQLVGESGRQSQFQFQ